MLLMVTIIISLLNELYAVFLVKTTVSGEALDE